MAINYPSAFDTATEFPQPSGTSPLTSPDHAGVHTNLSILGTQIQHIIGTTSGGSFFQTFQANDVPWRNKGGGGTLSDVMVAGTLNNTIQGSPTITGGTVGGALKNNGTIANGVYGTALYQGGTLAAAVVGTSLLQGGTLANATIGTPTLLGGTIAISGTVTPANIGAALAPTVGTIADAAAGTITANAQAGQVVDITMGTTAGNRTIGTPLNPTNGQVILYRIKQNTNNTGTVVWAAVFRGTAFTSALGTQSTWNHYSWRYHATDSKWDFQGNQTGLI
jgi:hypothetical protein